MPKRETIPRDAPLEGAALPNHLRAIASECRRTGRARLGSVRGRVRALETSLAVLRARRDLEELTPGAVWLVDNARMIEEACVSLMAELKKAPPLPSRHGEPRAARLVRAWLSHANGQVDGDALEQAAAAWQSAQQLTEEELAFLPLAARRALVLLLSDLCANAAETERDRTHAEASLDIDAKNRADAYWERLSFLLLEREDADALARLDARLAKLGTTAADVAEREHDRQTRACLWTANAVASLRALAVLDWRGRLESLSAMDRFLRQDPTGVYPRMDYASRGMYRRRAAKLARRFHVAEPVVAGRALALAEEGADDTIPGLSSHVGYYLMDEGQPLLWKALGKPPFCLRASRALGKHAALLYVVSIFTGSMGVSLLLYLLGVRGVLSALALLLAGEGFRQLAGLLLHRLSPPRRMPRLAPDRLDVNGVLVVVPTLLRNRAQALEMVRHLSVLRLANPESRLSYMLLGDFGDSPAASEPSDPEITDAALTAIRALNDVWNGGFYYLHRSREWNGKAGRFMAYERKRGALSTLNGLLLGEERKVSFAAASCEPASLAGKFELVITLDADTLLPPGTALELAGMLLHPLNRPCQARGARRGCAVIQPRMETSAATIRTRVARLWGGDGGFDPYLTAFSDIYQNLCGEGSFAGKGVYHVEAFESATRGKIPDNAILSHDLLEGGLAGSSLACDVALYDSQPGSLSAWMKRLHRWTRGDWQLLPWLLPFVRLQGKWQKNPLSMLNQYKIYDNLRRSLVPAAATLLLLGGMWANEPAAVLSGLLLPHVRGFIPLSRKSLLAIATHMALLPYEAAHLLDAVFRTLFRVLVSRKRLLEWVPTADTERQRQGETALRFLPNYLAAALLIPAALGAPAWLAFAIPLAAVWAAAPLTCRFLDGQERRPQPLTEAQRARLLDMAGRTFRFFEETVTPAANFLPPDNLQLEPPRGVVNRTSPTNIGMYLLACVSACELGLVDADGAARRIEKAVRTVERMEKWHGHLYNWYDVRTLSPLADRYVSSVDGGNLAGCLLLAAQALRSRLSEVDASLLTLPARLDALVTAMDFTRLYDAKSDLFYVGVSADTGLPGSAHYDLLASESRLLSYIAIMRREAPVKHWRRLGRAMARTRRGAALLSWSGTMFEYLLPTLFLKSPHGTLLGDTCLHAAREQVAAWDGAPWGVSESGYYAFDPSLAYQYKAFGLPSLALRTARAERVIAPYASALALSVLPREAESNLSRMAELGWLSDLGFYEAADYCKDRLPQGTEYRLTRSHMAHHQGMILASICNLLAGGVLTRYFHSLPQAEAYALLLEERKPTRAMLRRAAKLRQPDMPPRAEESLLRRADKEAFPPEAQALFGGGTTFVCDARGGGYISSNGLMLTRRRPDPFYEGGPQVYLRRPDGEVLRLGKAGEAWFDRSQALYRLEKGGLAAKLTCFVSPLDGAAVQLLALRASPDRDLELEAASFLEVCLASQASDESHPPFSSLAVETARLGPASAIARRRPRRGDETYPLLLHLFAGEHAAQARLETSRAAFLGRGERLDRPAALTRPIAEGETGAVIDPCVSLRVPLRVPAGTSLSCWFVTAAVPNEEKAAAMVGQYASLEPVLRALELAVTQDEVAAKYLGMDAGLQLSAQRMASWLLYPLSKRNAPEEGRGEALWPFGVSGDLPILAARVSRDAHLPLARALLKAHAYLRALGLWSDLLLISDQPGGYLRPLGDALHALAASGPSRDLIGQNAGPRLIDAASLGKEGCRNLLSHAALVLRGGEGSLSAQLLARRRVFPPPQHAWKPRRVWPPSRPAGHGSLGLDNGLGGFLADGSYVIHGRTPAPWCNVLANPRFGAVITERGGGYTWYENSRLKRLTAFAADPVRDAPWEFLWVRDEEDGQYASPWERALATHGFGFTRFEREVLGLSLTLTVFVDGELPAKCFLLEIANFGDQPRALTVTACARWLLGQHLADAGQVRCHAANGVAFARSPVLPQGVFLGFCGRRAEAAVDGAAFFGPGGVKRPRGMELLSLEAGGHESPAGIVRTGLIVEAGGRETVCCLLGVGSFEEIGPLFEGGGSQLRLARLRETWRVRQEALVPRAPDVATGLMLGCWLPYQALSARIFGRTGFYQSGGAVGFRDQLQDMLALRFTEPALVRAHLLEAAAHQFEDGDVQHWWHAPALGVRTRITDDRLFLPYVTSAYLCVTEDASVLAEEVPYLEHVAIPDGREDWYGHARPGTLRESLHSHNLRALRSIRLGGRGLPLMGAGDWNDGMNNLGAGGLGESVWLGFFLAVVLKEYAACCAPEEAQELSRLRDTLMDSLETHAWDGEWYLRAWFDDGTPVGGKDSPECAMDLVVQAWAALAGARRADTALTSALARLLDREAGVLKLLDPPFDGRTEPGYIRAYPPGVRENGGQYTHAAVWFLMALAKLGRMEEAWDLFFMLLPTSRGQDRPSALRYRGEPYVVAADAGAGKYPGRAGWTWYTGSASLLWSAGMETLLGFEKRGNRVRLRPSAPREWKGYSVEYRYGGARYILRAVRGERDDGWISLVDDGGVHEARYALKS